MWRTTLLLACFGLFSLAVCAPAAAQLPPPRPTAEEPARDDPAGKAARKAYEENLKAYAGNADVLVRPGLVADRSARTVTLWARFTNLTEHDPIEFFIIPPDSGKDYEALFVAYVKPSDVHAALEFIGVKPGRPVKFDENKYWPKGERVVASATWKVGNALRKVRLEELLIDTRTKAPLPPTGFVFTGSFMITTEEGKRMYAADYADPKSIASNYNDRQTVLDLPRQAPQGEVYGFQKLNPAHRFTPMQSAQIVLEPEYKDGKTRVRDLSLHVSAAKAGDGAKGAEYLLKDSNGKVLNETPTLVHVLAELGKLTEAGHDPFVTIYVDGVLPVSAVREVYQVMQQLDNEKGIRVEPPPPGHLYYRAFFPSDEWRDREQRLGRPWELHLSINNQKLHGRLELPADEIDRGSGKKDQTFMVASGEELVRTLGQHGDKWSQVIYIYAPADLKYGRMIGFVTPAMKTHPTMWVFVQK